MQKKPSFVIQDLDGVVKDAIKVHRKLRLVIIYLLRIFAKISYHRYNDMVPNRLHCIDTNPTSSCAIKY